MGVIGLGAFGESHVQAFRGLPHADVVAVASRSGEHARAVAARYDVPRWYEGYAGLIDDPMIEAVSVATAESDHREPAVAALRAGKHVLVEKPMASTLADALAIVDAARRSSSLLMPGHILRFETKYAAMKNAVDAKVLGRLTAISARRNRPRSLVTSHGRVHPALVTAIHDVDVMLWLTGDRVRTVRAIHRLSDRDDGAHGLWALLEFEHGTVGTLETAWTVPDEVGLGADDAFEVIGRSGTAKIQFDVPAFRVWRRSGVHVPDVSYEPRVHGAVTGALKEEVSYFATCALTGTPPSVVTPTDGLNALVVVLALIESAERNADVAVAWPANSTAEA